MDTTPRDVPPQGETDQACESEERYRALSEAAFEGIVLHENGCILQANDAMARLFGYERQELVGMTILELAAPDSREKVRQLAASGYSQPYTANGLRKDGTTFEGELQGKDTVYQGRRVRVTAIRDLTDRLRIERELRQTSARWHSVMANSPDFIMLVEPDGRIEYMNRTQPGLAREAVIGKPIYDFVSEPQRQRVREAFRKVFEGGLAQHFETEGTGPNGELATYQTRVVPLKDGAGVPCALAIATDVTPIRQASLRIAHQAVALEQAHELHRAKSDFVNAVSHELRTPLTTIFGYLEFLEDRIGGELSPEQAEFVAQLMASARRLSRLVDDLLDFARMEAGTFSLHQQEVDLGSQLEASVRSFLPLAVENDIHLEVVPLGEPLSVCIDPHRIAQVLGNLLSNALKFTPPGGSVRLEVTRDHQQARLAVRDTGVGIAPSDMPRLFQRFTQLKAGLKSGRGTGLGLSISKAIVEAHGGAIGANSPPGSGSEFWFTLPLAEAGPVCPEADAAAPN